MANAAGRRANVVQSADTNHVAALLIIRVGVEQIVTDVFENGLDLLAGHGLRVHFGIGRRRLGQHVFHRDRLTLQHAGSPTEARRQRNFGVELLAQGVAEQAVHRTVEIAPAIQQLAGGRYLLGISGGIGCAQPIDQRLHFGVRLEQFGEYRKQPIAHVANFALGKIEIEHAKEFAVRAGIGHQRGAARIGDRDRLRDGIMGMAAQNHVDAADPARELEVDVHAVV